MDPASAACRNTIVGQMTKVVDDNFWFAITTIQLKLSAKETKDNQKTTASFTKNLPIIDIIFAIIILEVGWFDMIEK